MKRIALTILLVFFAFTNICFAENTLSLVSRDYVPAIGDQDAHYWSQFDIEGYDLCVAIPVQEGDTDEKALAYVNANYDAFLRSAKLSVPDWAIEEYKQAITDLKQIEGLTDQQIQNSLEDIIRGMATIQKKTLKALKKMVDGP